MKLSVIICVYNTDIAYLRKCLESIAVSTVKDLEGGYEICMVDDGSTLDYSELISKYPIKYTKTENRGIFSARKTGADMASGEYSIYCDSDDTVSFNYYLPMVEKAVTENCDIVINDWATETTRTKNVCINDDTVRLDIALSGDDILCEFVRNEGRQHSYYVLWNKVYRTELLRSAFKNLETAGLPERTSYSEDAAINFFIWRDAKRLSNVHTGYYFYRIHSSQTVNVTSAEKLGSQIKSMAKTLGIMRAETGENKHRSEILRKIDGWAALMSRSHYTSARSGKHTELYPLIKETYGVEKLRTCTVEDGASYAKKLILGTNFDNVDALLLSLWDSKDKPSVAYKGKDLYIKRSLKFLSEKKKIELVNKNADITVPKLSTPFKERLIYSPLFYKLGLVLFKKGSKLREFFKKFL